MGILKWWQTVVEPDPNNPMAQIHSQRLLPKPQGAPKPGTAGTPGIADTVIMTDTQGNRVKVPKAKAADFVKKGYK